MVERHVHFVGDRDPSLTDTINDDTGAALNLTGGAVRFKMRAVGSSTLKVDAVAAIVSASAGTVRYDWAALDVDTSGFYVGWWEITLSGNVRVEREFLLEFRAHGQTSAWLVELNDVRLAMELRENADDLDDQIEQLIPVASARIMEEISRELAPPSTAVARSFPVDGYIIDLTPYDLRAATTVVLDPSGANNTLVANTDYKLLPIGLDRFGVYTEIELSRYLLAPVTRFRQLELRVTGNWGFATIPDIARKACIDTVRSWLRVPAARSAYVDADMGAMTPDPGSYYGLPPAVRNTLRPLYRSAAPV